MPSQDKVLDSWSLPAFFEDEPAAGKVEKIIVNSVETRARMWITSINLGEVWYSIARAHC